MANDATKILVASPPATGGLFLSETVLTQQKMPVDATTALDAGLINHGLVTPDGVTRTVERQTESIKAWGGDTWRIIQTDHDVKIQCSVMQWLSIESQKLVRNPANVTSAAAGITSLISSDPLIERSLVIVAQDQGNAIRWCARRVVLESVGDEKLATDSATTLDLTFRALPIDGNVKMRDYIKHAA